MMTQIVSQTMGQPVSPQLPAEAQNMLRVVSPFIPPWTQSVSPTLSNTMMTQIVSQTMGQPVSIEEKQAQLPAEAPVVAPILTPTMTQSVSPTLSTTMMTQIVSQTMTQTVPPNETYALTRFSEPCVSQTMRLSESTNYNVSEPIVTPASLEELENMVQNYSSVSQTMRLSASTTKATLEELETKEVEFSNIQNDLDVDQLCLEDLVDVFMDENSIQDIGPDLENEKNEDSPERIEFDAGVGFEIPEIPMEIEDCGNPMTSKLVD